MLISSVEGSESHDKDHYLRAAVAALNEASRIQPSFPLLQLARGVYSTLRSGVEQNPATKQQLLEQAQASFEDCIRSTGGRNLMALIGRARVLFAKKKYDDAYKAYQQVLAKNPDLIEPDPRIGLGCCLWQLSHDDKNDNTHLKEHARVAWQRALELNPKSKVASQLLGLYHLWKSSTLPTDHEEFQKHYSRAMFEYTSSAFKLDKSFPLSNVTLSPYFFTNPSNVANPAQKLEKTAQSAINMTDANPVASDGWFQLARKAHRDGDLSKALDYYQRADAARGGNEQSASNRERGYLPAKFGAAQVRMMQGDHKGAERLLDRIDPQVTKSKHHHFEIPALLGSLAAEDVFNAPVDAVDKEAEEKQLYAAAKRALVYLNTAKRIWSNPKRPMEPDPSVLLNLARLYEQYDINEKGEVVARGNSSKVLECLLQVQEIEFSEFSTEGRPSDPEGLQMWREALTEQLTPHLLNNIGCLYFRAEKFVEAEDIFKKAMRACTKLESIASADADALMTTITYNLGRSLEALRDFENAKAAYEELLKRHGEYFDARVRLAFITLVQSPGEENKNKILRTLHDENSGDMEVRALWGWYLRKSKRRNPRLNEDVEQRHFKRSLQNYNQPHDQYSLTAMGNIVLAHAREDFRHESQKDQRREEYNRAMLFFKKALDYDRSNAYAAQGLAIYLIEDRQDYSTALQVLSQAKETMTKDHSVHLNLGHLYCELKQYSRAIESYELALQKKAAENAGLHASDGTRQDIQILGCLGRAWLLRGKAEKSLSAMKRALEHSQLALAEAPDKALHLRFNIAFVEIQLAQMVRTIAEKDRLMEDVAQSSQDVEEAITILEDMRNMANVPAPFDRSYIEQLANMSKNTLRKQMDREVQKQKEYEEKNAERFAKAREAREAEMQRRDEERRKAAEAAEEERQRIAEERKRMQERDREIAAEREEEERRLREEEEPKYDSEGNVVEKKSKQKKGSKRKKKSEDFINDDDDLGLDGDGGGADGSEVTPPASGDERPRKKKKRRVEKKGKDKPSKYKSADRIDRDDDLPAEQSEQMDTADDGVFGEEGADVDMSDAAAGAAAPTRKSMKVIDDDEEDEDAPAAKGANGVTNGDVNEEEE